MTKSSAIILDIDGTLLDSNDAHARAWAQALAERGHVLPLDRVRRCIGMGGDKLLPTLLGWSEDSPEGKAASERRKQLFRAGLASLRPLPGARALLERLRGEGHRLVVATSAGADEVDALLRQANVADLLELRTTKDSVDASKPDPDVIEAALELVGVPAEAAIMVGDTPYDAIAASRARVRFVGVRSGGWSFEGNHAPVLAIYDDCADILARWDSSPFRRA